MKVHFNTNGFNCIFVVLKDAWGKLDLKRLKPLVAFATVLTGYCALKTSWVPHFSDTFQWERYNVTWGLLD